MNKIHPTLKFTLNHTTPENEADCDNCDCESKTFVPFLDTSISIEQGKIEVDLYTKETDRNQYLLPSSCHPKTTTKSIPFSLSLRIIRICTKTQDRDKRLGELKELLLARDYPELLIESAIKKALNIQRKIALLKVKTKNTVRNRPVFCLKYDPRILAIQTIQARHWRSMKYQDKYMEELVKEPPLAAFKKQRNIRDILIKSKVPPAPNRYPNREVNGMAKCGKDCTSCPYVKTGQDIKISDTETWKINRKFTCETNNRIYILECTKCSNRYIGETSRMLKARLSEHRGYINNKVVNLTISTSQATAWQI